MERLLAEVEKDIKTLERVDMILIMVRGCVVCEGWFVWGHGD